MIRKNKLIEFQFKKEMSELFLQMCMLLTKKMNFK